VPASYDQSDAECLVYTFKEGLLSPMAHDLKLRVGRFRLTVADDASAVAGTFETASVGVVCAMKDGAEAPAALSGLYRSQIDKNVAKEVLLVKKHPEARFASTSVAADGDGYRVRGTLTLSGRSRDIELHAQRRGERLVARVRLHQPDFGIKPFSAMLGTLKIQPGVAVEISVPAP
jgi:hypothetical protein